MPFFSCFKNHDIHKSFADIFTHQEERVVKQFVIQVLRKYAQSTTNKIDDALVDEIQNRLLYPQKRQPTPLHYTKKSSLLMLEKTHI